MGGKGETTRGGDGNRGTVGGGKESRNTPFINSFVRLFEKACSR